MAFRYAGFQYFRTFGNRKATLPALDTLTQDRAERSLQIYLESGVTHVRTHVDIYPEAGLDNLEAVQQALCAFEGKLSYEIVAFPRHGLRVRNQRS